jgi:peptide/nickel transport system permease protein
LRRFVARRLLLGLFIIIGVLVLTFLATRVAPSDPAQQWAGPRATPAQVEKAAAELGLDKPLPVQLLDYLKNVARGDLGTSLQSHRPVASDLRDLLPATLELIFFSTLIGASLGILLGVVSAMRKDTWLDSMSRVVSVGAVSIPVFWLALFSQLLLFRWLGLLPLGGQQSLAAQMASEAPRVTGFLAFDALLNGDFGVLGDALVHLIMPALVLSAYSIGLVARMTRAALVEVLNEDYIRAARSYGIRERTVVWRFALKNSLGPTATVLALSIGYTLTNTFLIEAIFQWPGIGAYIAQAVTSLDYPAIVGVTIVSAVAYVLLNLVADFVIALDPRVRR